MGQLTPRQGGAAQGIEEDIEQAPHAKKAEAQVKQEALERARLVEKVETLEAGRARRIEQHITAISTISQGIYRAYQKEARGVWSFIAKEYRSVAEEGLALLTAEQRVQQGILEMKRKGVLNWLALGEYFRNALRTFLRGRKLLDQWEKQGFLSVFEAHYLLLLAYQGIQLTLARFRSTHDREAQLAAVRELRVWINAVAEFAANVKRIDPNRRTFDSWEMEGLQKIILELTDQLKRLSSIILLGSEDFAKYDLRQQIEREYKLLEKAKRELESDIAYNIHLRPSAQVTSLLAEVGLGGLARELLTRGMKKGAREVLAKIVEEMARRQRDLRQLAFSS